MFKDMQVSGTLMDQYKEYRDNLDRMEVSRPIPLVVRFYRFFSSLVCVAERRRRRPARARAHDRLLAHTVVHARLLSADARAKCFRKIQTVTRREVNKSYLSIGSKLRPDWPSKILVKI